MMVRINGWYSDGLKLPSTLIIPNFPPYRLNSCWLMMKWVMGYTGQHIADYNQGSIIIYNPYIIAIIIPIMITINIYIYISHNAQRSIFLLLSVQYELRWIWDHLCFLRDTIVISLWIQTLSEKVLNPLNQSESSPKYFLGRYLDP